MSDHRRLLSCLRIALTLIVAGAMLNFSLPSLAEVKTSTVSRAYHVGGSTASSLVSYMRSRPLQGDYGNAIANIRPSYGLSVSTKMVGASCRAANVTLNLRFVVTLPTAKTSSMAAGTRSAWNAFAAYARQHENTHKRIYIECGNSFVAKAKAMSASSCGALQASIRRLLESEKRLCERRHLAYDRAERSRVANLTLFRLARGGSRSARR